MWFSVHAALLLGPTPAAGDEPESTAARQERESMDGQDRDRPNGEPERADTETTAAEVSRVDPAQGARHAKLLGAGNCSWSTSRMAARAVSEGRPYTFVGHLEASENSLTSRVATPYTVGPDAAIHVVANEVLEVMEREQVVGERLDLRGRLVEVDGVRYLAITDFVRVGA